jgi:tellurite resistance protein
MTRTNPLDVTVLEHQMRERFGDPNAFGITFPASPALFADAGKLVAAIAGADGSLSRTEREALEASARVWGAPPEAAKMIGGFNLQVETVESLASKVPRGLAGTLLYDGIRIASVDGFHDKERQASIRAAKAIGFEATIVPGIVALLRVENALATTRVQLLNIPSDVSNVGKGPAIPGNADATKREYGVVGPIPREGLVAISKALLSIAAGDSELTEAELRWYVGQSRSLAIPDDVIEETMKADLVGVPFERIMTPEMRPFARSILFDGIRCASADGYAARERELAHRAAKRLGLTEDYVIGVENQLHAEAAARESRVELLRAR